MELTCLLMWLWFGSVTGSKPEKCPVLPRTEFADVTAERYPPGTKLYYECDSGYTRRSGQYSGIWCQSGQPAAGWRYKDFQCIDRNTLLSAAPTKNLDLTQETERKPASPAPQKPGNVSEVEEQGFCGPPKTIPHASIRPSNQYYLGQVLHFKCQSGYDKRPPTSGTRTCKKEQGQIIWTVLDMRCTSDSSEWSPQAAEPALVVVLLIIPALFV